MIPIIEPWKSDSRWENSKKPWETPTESGTLVEPKLLGTNDKCHQIPSKKNNKKVEGQDLERSFNAETSWGWSVGRGQAGGERTEALARPQAEEALREGWGSRRRAPSRG